MPPRPFGGDTGGTQPGPLVRHGGQSVKARASGQGLKLWPRGDRSRLARDKEAIEVQTTNLWNAETTSPGSVTERDCREVQDQTYQLRRSGMQIPQIVYNALRSQNEDAMRAAVDRYVANHSSSSGHGS